MSDYSISTSLLRDQMAAAIAENEEQFFYVICEAVECVDFDEACEFSDYVQSDAELVAKRLRAMASLIFDSEDQ